MDRLIAACGSKPVYIMDIVPRLLLVACCDLAGHCSNVRCNQRWASTLANRSNARHRSNIRAPPRPLPTDVCNQSVGICVARGAGSNS
jgi:hypothetical protein